MIHLQMRFLEDVEEVGPHFVLELVTLSPTVSWHTCLEEVGPHFLLLPLNGKRFVHI